MPFCMEITMQYYMAPLEGITGYIFRNALEDFFPGADKYYAPFITPPVKRELNFKETKDLGKENNSKYKLVPQVLTNDAKGFLLTKEILRDMGYDEVNINLGCPSKTVTGKGRGSGALKDLEKLDAFLYEVFEDGDEKISIKTRIGVNEPDEFYRIMEIYTKYPIMELTVHPRLMVQAYKGQVHRDVFFDALKEYKRPICYNGDINSVTDRDDFLLQAKEKLTDSVPGSAIGENGSVNANLSAIMCGRGVLRNPSLFRELKGGEKASKDEIAGFLKRILDDYTPVMSGEIPTLYKMKEIWSYLGDSFDRDCKEYKKLMKSKSLSEYKIYEKQILRS